MTIKDINNKIKGKEQSISVQTDKLEKAGTAEAKAEIQKVIDERNKELVELKKQLSEAEKNVTPQVGKTAKNDTEMATNKQTESQRWESLSQAEKDKEMLKRSGQKQIWRNPKGHYFTSENLGKLSLDKGTKENLTSIK